MRLPSDMNSQKISVASAMFASTWNEQKSEEHVPLSMHTRRLTSRLIDFLDSNVGGRHNWYTPDFGGSS